MSSMTSKFPVVVKISSGIVPVATRGGDSLTERKNRHRLKSKSSLRMIPIGALSLKVCVPVSVFLSNLECVCL